MNPRSSVSSNLLFNDVTWMGRAAKMNVVAAVASTAFVGSESNTLEVALDDSPKYNSASGLATSKSSSSSKSMP